MAAKRTRKRRASSQTFCERAEDYCPPRRRSNMGGLESMAALAVLYMLASAVTTAPAGDARGGAAPALKPPRKTQPQPTAATSEPNAETKP